MHSDEERLPLACLPGATESPPPLDCVDAAPYEQKLPPAPMSLSPAPASASIPSPRGRLVGPVAMDFTGYRRHSSSACNALPAIAGGTRRLAYVPCLYHRVTYPQQLPFLLRTLLSLCAAQSTTHLLTASHLLSLPYILMLITLATPPR